jgi:hypothetical protein
MSAQVSEFPSLPIPQNSRAFIVMDMISRDGYRNSWHKKLRTPGLTLPGFKTLEPALQCLLPGLCTKIFHGFLHPLFGKVIIPAEHVFNAGDIGVSP